MDDLFWESDPLPVPSSSEMPKRTAHRAPLRPSLAVWDRGATQQAHSPRIRGGYSDRAQRSKERPKP
jgi:hypothetical protein